MTLNNENNIIDMVKIAYDSFDEKKIRKYLEKQPKDKVILELQDLLEKK